MTLWQQLTDTEREALVQRVLAELIACGVPDHLRGGLLRYFADGILPGSFLQAVLCNDLRAAIYRAAPGSIAALPSLITFLDAAAPAAAVGSRAALLAWTTTPDRLEV